MPLVIKESEQHFEPAPPGLHRAVCVDVVDLGMVEGKFGAKRKLKLVFQIEKRNKLKERFQARQSYTQSLMEGSNLRRDLKTWRGRDFTPEEIKAFDVEKLLGVNCQLSLTHETSKSTGRVYAKVTAVLPAQKGAPKLEAEAYEREPWAKDEAPGEVYEVDPIDEGGAAQYDDDSVPF